MRSHLLTALVAPAFLGAVACSNQDGLLRPDDASPSRAFGIWKPGSVDTCTQEQHDAYAVLGPDGKAYPSWHPPTGPGGCSFGHEHGRDPRGSDLYADLGGLPLYLFPRTAVLGVILITGYLGGATATQVRVHDPWFLFPVALGAVAWGGLWLRDSRLRALLPLTRRPEEIVP